MSEKTIPRYEIESGCDGLELTEADGGPWVLYADIAPLLEGSTDSRLKTQDNDRLREIQARVEKATAGPWHLAIHCDELGDDPDRANVEAGAADVADGALNADADFIAHAREDIPYLLAEIARLRSTLPQGQEP